jgi:hypothetical protein
MSFCNQKDSQDLGIFDRGCDILHEIEKQKRLVLTYSMSWASAEEEVDRKRESRRGGARKVQAVPVLPLQNSHFLLNRFFS